MCGGDFASLGTNWMNLLLPIGAYIHKPGKDSLERDGGIVVCATLHGAILWHVHIDAASSISCLVMGPSNPTLPRWRYLALQGDLSEWKVREYRVLPPKSFDKVRSGQGMERLPSQIAVQVCAEDSSLVSAAAWNGFRGMTVPLLGKLMTILGLKFQGRRPTREADIIAALARHAIPDLTDEQLAEIQRTRSSKRRVDIVPSLLDDPDNVEISRDLFDPGDLKDSKKQLDRAAARAGATSRGSARSAPTASSSSSSGVAARPRSAAPAVAPAEGGALVLADAQPPAKERLPLPGVPIGNEVYRLADACRWWTVAACPASESGTRVSG